MIAAGRQGTTYEPFECGSMTCSTSDGGGLSSSARAKEENMVHRCLLATVTGLFVAGAACAEPIVHVHLVNPDGIGRDIGTITIRDSGYGLILTPDLGDLTPGAHGFHVHQNADCGPAKQDERSVAGLAAGGHLDPMTTDKHTGPYGSGHFGDLPVLVVGADGRATLPVLAPRLKMEDLSGHTLMIHAGGDNYSDEPAKLGGGGARVACGVVTR
jgi:Cu-Zn family superoxide dismutase